MYHLSRSVSDSKISRLSCDQNQNLDSQHCDSDEHHHLQNLNELTETESQHCQRQTVISNQINYGNANELSNSNIDIVNEPALLAYPKTRSRSAIDIQDEESYDNVNDQALILKPLPLRETRPDIDNSDTVTVTAEHDTITAVAADQLPGLVDDLSSDSSNVKLPGPGPDLSESQQPEPVTQTIMTKTTNTVKRLSSPSTDTKFNLNNTNFKVADNTVTNLKIHSDPVNFLNSGYDLTILGSAPVNSHPHRSISAGSPDTVLSSYAESRMTVTQSHPVIEYQSLSHTQSQKSLSQSVQNDIQNQIQHQKESDVIINRERNTSIKNLNEVANRIMHAHPASVNPEIVNSDDSQCNYTTVDSISESHTQNNYQYQTVQSQSQSFFQMHHPGHPTYNMTTHSPGVMALSPSNLNHISSINNHGHGVPGVHGISMHNMNMNNFNNPMNLMMMQPQVQGPQGTVGPYNNTIINPNYHHMLGPNMLPMMPQYHPHMNPGLVNLVPQGPGQNLNQQHNHCHVSGPGPVGPSSHVQSHALGPLSQCPQPPIVPNTTSNNVGVAVESAPSESTSTASSNDSSLSSRGNSNSKFSNSNNTTIYSVFNGPSGARVGPPTQFQNHRQVNGPQQLDTVGNFKSNSINSDTNNNYTSYSITCLTNYTSDDHDDNCVDDQQSHDTAQSHINGNQDQIQIQNEIDKPQRKRKNRGGWKIRRAKERVAARENQGLPKIVKPHHWF